LRLFRTIAAPTPVAAQLAADGRWMPVHHARDLALVMSGFAEDGNLVSLGLGEVCVVHSVPIRLLANSVSRS
jgi:hypothetical protein